MDVNFKTENGLVFVLMIIAALLLVAVVYAIGGFAVYVILKLFVPVTYWQSVAIFFAIMVLISLLRG